MSKYRKIFHHVSSKDVRKKHQDGITQLRIKEEKKIKLLDYTSSAMEVVKYDWRSGGDLSAELREAMTTANVYQKLGTHDDGEIEDQIIDTSLETSFEDGPVNGLENMMFKQTMVSDGGSGVGANGGFDIGKHLKFGGTTSSDGRPYVSTESRHALLAPIDARNTDIITITAIRGNDSNGGELPDYVNEELRLMWFHADTEGYNGVGSWRDIDFDSNGERHNDISPTIIPVVSGDSSGYDGSFPGLRDWTITIPEWCKNENQRFGLWQLSHSGHQWDHYGITKITYRARTPSNAFVALDKPEASSFVRFGTSEGDPKKRKKKLEDQLKASKEYTDTVLGTDFPGGSATLSEPTPSPIGYDNLAKTHIQAGTLSQQLKKALGKETSTQKTTTTANNTLQAIKSLGKVEAIKQKTVTSLTTKEKTEIINNIGQEKYEKIETVSKTPSFENISIKHIQQVQSEIGDIETQNLSERKPEEIKQQVHNVAQKNPEFANAMQRVGTAGKVYANYLIGNLPDTIDNSYLGDDYVNSVFASDKAHVLDDGSLSLGDFVIGSSSPVSYDPVTNQLVVPFNYDFDTNEEQIMKDPDKYDATKLVPAIGMTAAWIVGGKYGLDSVPVPGAGYATWLSKALGIGGKHTPGELKISPQELQKLNPNLYTQLIGRGLIPLEKFQDPYGEENYKQNLPGWFTFGSRDEHGRIWGHNYSGGWGVLSPGPGSGDPGTAESGYGTAGFDWNTQSGGTSWTFTIGDDVPEIPPKPDEELPAGKKWELIPYDPASKAPPMWTQVDIDPVAGVDELFNQNATTKEENEIADTLESEELDETKLESIFDSDASIVSRALESARDPAYSYQNGDDTVLYGYDMGGAWRDIQYTSGPKLQWRPPEVDGVSSYNISGLEFTILKPNERWTGDWKTKEEVSIDKWWPQQQIEEILGDKLFYDKDEDYYYRVAENHIADLPDAKDYIADKGKLAFHDSWSSTNIWENYLSRFQEYQGKGKESVWTTSDGKTAWGWVPPGTMKPEKYGGGPSDYTSDPEVKEINARYWEVWNEHQRLMGENDQQYRDERKIPTEIYRNKVNDLKPIVTKHNLEKKEIAKEEKAYKEVAKHNLIKANGVPRYESCFGTSCKWYTRDDGTKFKAGPPVLHRRDYIVKGRDDNKYVIYKKGDPVLFFPSGKGTGKFEGKWEKYDNRKIYDELAHNVELWKEENYGPWYEKYNNLSQYGANITLEYEQAVWDLKMQKLIRSAQNTKTIRDMMDNDPLSDSYIGDKDKDPETPPKPGDTPEDSDEVTPEDEKWLDTQQTLVNLTKVLTHIGLPNDFGQWSINYAKGDMTPITQFSAGMRREVESMVLKKFKENPNSKTVSIQYSDYGWKFKNMSSRLGLGRFTATRLPNGKVRIDDTFNVDQTFKTVGAFDIIPTLQDTANRIVDIAHKRRNINTYDEGGIPVKVTLDMKSKLKRLDLSVDDPIVRDSTPKRKRKKSNYTPSKISESKKENSFDKIRRVSRDYDYDKIKVVEEPIVIKPKVKVVQEIKKRSDWRTELKESDWTPVSSGRPTMSTSQTFQHASGATATFNALSGPDAHPDTVTITAYGDTFSVDAPTINEIPLQGHASPIDGWKMARKNNEKKAKETNAQLGAAKDATQRASGASEFMNARVTEEDEVKDKMALIKKRLKELDTWKKDVVKAQNDHYDKYQNTIQEKILDPINNIISKYNLDTYSTFTGAGGHSYKVVDNPDAGKPGQPPQVLVSLSVNGLNAKYSSKTNVRIYWPTQKNGAWQPLSIEDISGKGIKTNSSFGSKFSNDKSGVRDATFMVKNLGNVVLDENQTAPEYTKFELPKAPPNLQRNLDAGWKPLGHEFDYNQEPIEKEFIKAMKKSPLFKFAGILGSGSDAAGRMMIKQLELDFSTWDKSPGKGFDKRVLVLINRALDRKMPIGEVKSTIYGGVNAGDEAKDFPVRAALQSINYKVTDKGIRIIDTFDFDGNTSLGYGAQYPGLQRNADQMVTIAARQAAELGWDMKTTWRGKSLTIKPGIDWKRTVQKHSSLPNAKSGLPDKMVFDPGGNEEARMKAWLQLPEDEQRHLMMVNYYNSKEMAGPLGQGGPHGIPWPIPVLNDRTTPEGFDFKVDYTIPWSQVSPELRSRLSGKQTTKSTTSKGRLDAYGGVDKLYDKKNKKKKSQINKK